MTTPATTATASARDPPTAPRHLPYGVPPGPTGSPGGRGTGGCARRAPLLVVLASAALLCAVPAPAARADTGPGAPPDTTPPVEVSGNDRT
ncbi:hypothetical protein NKH77_33540 [Streptomyces sp. M19]